MDSDHTTPTERLWAPWRMRYISGNDQEVGCIFCNRLAANHDTGSLILHRGEHTFSIMNLFPYNTGHIMLVPNQHAADPGELTRKALHEIGETLPLLTSALRRVFGCDGFNVGLNIGAVAGAGVAAHLHEHIVPRWQGDANFMPILASTMVIPETIPVTYAKIRAEVERGITGAGSAQFVVFDASGERALLHHGRIPEVPLTPETPVWKTTIEAIPEGMGGLDLVGWAGADSARNPGVIPVALTFRGHAPSEMPDEWCMTPITDSRLDPATAATILRAHAQLAPSI